MKKESSSSRYLDRLRENPYLLSGARRLPVPKGDILAEVSGYVLGPALAAFTHWLLQDAMERGIHRLYFLARDGYFFYHAALDFRRRLSIPIECRYLSCSRYSLRIPFFHVDREAALDFICRGGIDITLYKILSRAGLSGEDIQEVLQVLGGPYGKDEIIPYAELSQIRSCLSRCPAFLERMNQRSREAFPGLTGYLKQEGFLDTVPMAIVDSGWTGSIQKTLQSARKQCGGTGRLHGYYWGLYELPADICKASYHSYYFSPEGNLKEKVHFNNCVFEAVFTAPHGMTLEYAEKDGRYEPMYAPIREERIAFVEKTGEYMALYIRELLNELDLQSFKKRDLSVDRQTVGELLRLFMDTPTRQEAELFGNLSFSDDVLDRGDQRLAAPLSEEDIKANHVLHKLLVMSGRLRASVRESAWYEGSVVRCGRKVSYHLAQYTLYKYMRYIWKNRRARQKRQEGRT